MRIKAWVTGVALSVAALCLSGCMSGHAHHDKPTASNLPAAPSASPPPYSPQGLTKPLDPIPAELVEVCPDMDAVNLSSLDIKFEDVEHVHACFSTGDYLMLPPTQEWFDTYSVSDELSGENQACIAVAVDPEILWVTTGSGSITAVYAPKDSCGFPQTNASMAYTTLLDGFTP